ncbi:MAG: DUF2202 domain-containing protein [Archaeoglobaceae archaeon]|nr:DUF2202 domain-containing protein [Archaeoglobaceae archaeon]
MGFYTFEKRKKLAIDAYQTLYEKWKLPIFANIARSEQTHMEAVGLLIDKYGLKDPVESKGVGEFTNPKFQDLYNKLVEESSKSIESALKIGAVIEEVDIIDLQKHLTETNKKDIKLVYGNLIKVRKTISWRLHQIWQSVELSIDNISVKRNMKKYQQKKALKRV